MNACEPKYSLRLLGIQVFIIIHVSLVVTIDRLNITCHLYSFNQCFKVFVHQFYANNLVFNDKDDYMRGICQILSTHIQESIKQSFEQ